MTNDNDEPLKWPFDKEPNEILLQFLDQLPATIKEAVLFQCKYAISDRSLLGIAPDSWKIVTKFLNGERPESNLAYDCAMLIGALEMILVPNRPGSLERLNAELFEETGVEVFRQIAMRQPLADKHREAAWSAFQELRKRDLSPFVLRLWIDFRSD